MTDRYWEGYRDGAADTRERFLAKQTRLQAQVNLLIEQHGGTRKAANALGLDAAYLSRLANGEKENPSDDTLERLGLRRHVHYTRTDGQIIPECPRCLAVMKAACTC